MPEYDFKFTYVLGAGASHEVGLPIGTALRDDIAKLVDIKFEHGFRQKTGDQVVMDALRRASQDPTFGERDVNKLLHCCWKIRDALPQSISIDNLIDTHRGNKHIELCGKLGIARAILEAERKSKLYFDVAHDRSPKLTYVKDTWLTSFMQILTEGCPLSDLEERLASLAFVVFNYDRVLEQFLYYSFQNVYHIDQVRAAELVRSMTILRPYGSVGGLPSIGLKTAFPFGHEPSGDELRGLAQGIKTFTEGVDPATSDIAAIRHAVVSTEKLVFLGFAFHPTNLDLLFPSSRPSDSLFPKRTFATGKGLREPARADVQSELTTRACGNVEIAKDATCSDLFADYWRQLSMAR